MTDRILASSRIASEEGDPAAWLYLLHGIYGSGRNWGSVARRLVERRPEWGVILVDLRLHGASTGFEGPHTVRACAEDVLRLERSLGLPATALLGHSFGGKVALAMTEMEPEQLRQVWIADSTLRVGEPTGSAWRVVEIVRGLPPVFETRDDLADALEREGYERGVGLWLGMNLERGADGFRWKLPWDGVEEMLRDYFRTDVWPVVENPPPGVDVHVIRATRSEAVDAESAARIRAADEATGRVHLHELDAGHWLNVDNPDAVLELLAEGLPEP